MDFVTKAKRGFRPPSLQTPSRASFGMPRYFKTLLLIAAFYPLAPPAFAQSAASGGPPVDPTIAIAEHYAFNQPALITRRALTGVYTAVTRAGNRLVAVGERGWILLSDDNGVSWRQVEAPTSVTLTDVAFASPQEGWAVGGMGLVLHSTDGGVSWKKQFNGTQAAALALTSAQADIKQFGANATTTVNLQSAQSMVAAGPAEPFLDVYLAKASDVMIAGAFGMAFSSADNGATWTSLVDDLPDPNGLHIYQIAQDGANFAVVGEQGFVLYGPPGKPLSAVSTPFQGTFFGETFAPDHSWIIFGLQGTILRSADHGVHWTTIVAGSAVGIDCGMVLNNGDVLLGNIAGELLDSHDNGQSFNVVVLKAPVVGLAQAADGAVIAAGPGGPVRISLDKLAAGA